jgi:hypothetical protein
MTQTERFLQFVQQRREKAIQGVQLLVRIDGDTLVVTRRWQVSGTEDSTVQAPSIPRGTAA